MMFIGIAHRLMSSLDKVIIFTMLGSETAGYYSIAVFFSETIIIIPQSLAVVLLPRLMYQRGKGADLTKLGYLFDKPMRLLAWLLPVILGLIILNLEIALQLLLPAYLPALGVLQILVMGIFFVVILSIPKGILVIFDRQRIFLVAIPLFLLLGSIMNVLAIKLGYGMVGVAYASVLFYFLVSLTTILYALKIFDRNHAQIRNMLIAIYIPFIFSISALLLITQVEWAENIYWDSLLRSGVFLVICTPLLIWANAKLALWATLRGALFTRNFQ